jgi:two-component system OmpR family response regulator
MTVSARGRGALHILVVEDEEPIRELVRVALEYEGYDVDTAESGRAALTSIAARSPDLVLLDVQLPDLDGFEVQARMRRDRIDVPVVFLTARDAVSDRVHGLTNGADDYLTKPFSIEELVARVGAVLRRSGRSGQPRTARYGSVELDDDERRVRVNAEAVDLSPTEYQLLRYLVDHAPNVLSKAQILQHVWPYSVDGDTNVVETYISYVRRKIDGDGPSLIRTVRGLGYSMARPSDGDWGP